MPSLRRANLNRALDRGGEYRVNALKEMWEYLEEVYGKEALEVYMKTGEWIKEPPEGLKSSVKGVEEAAEITEKLKKAADAELDLKAALEEINRILKENKDIPPDTPVTGEPPIAPPRRAPGRVATKVKPEAKPRVKPKVKTLTAEEIAEMMKVKVKPTPRESAFPGIKFKPKEVVREAQVMRQGVPIPLVTAAPAVAPVVAPAPAPTPAPVVAPAPLPLHPHLRLQLCPFLPLRLHPHLRQHPCLHLCLCRHLYHSLHLLPHRHLLLPRLHHHHP